MGKTIHVVPIGDLIAHDISTDQADCICGPYVVCHRSQYGDNWQIVHVSLDGREKTMAEQKQIYPPLTEEEFTAGTIETAGVSFSETEDGDYIFGWGHQGKTKFAAAVNQYDLEMTGEESSYSADDVMHCEAVTVGPPDSVDGWWISWAKEHQEHPLSFALTLVHR